jgi:hypothetical protein
MEIQDNRLCLGQSQSVEPYYTDTLGYRKARVYRLQGDESRDFVLFRPAFYGHIHCPGFWIGRWMNVLDE